MLDLGEQALTGIFPHRSDAPITRGSLRLVQCKGGPHSCGLVQLGDTFDLGEMYGDQYGYRSGLNASMVRHLHEKVAWLQERRPVEPGDVVLDIGSNDGTTLGFYSKSVRRIGIDPTTDKFRQYHGPGIEALADFFSAEAYRSVAGSQKARIITSISMFYDLPSPMSFVEDIASVLADDGVWHLEQSYLPSMLQTNSYDTVCHEHLEYYSLAQLKFMFDKVGLNITDVSFNDVNGGSFAVTVSRGEPEANELERLLDAEKFVESERTWADFAAVTARHRDELPEALRGHLRRGERVVGMGASTKGNVVLQYCKIGPELLPCIAEVNPDKFGAFTPGTGIPIASEHEVLRGEPDVLMVLPWHFRSTFEKTQDAFLRRGGKLMFPLPNIDYVAR